MATRTDRSSVGPRLDNATLNKYFDKYVVPEKKQTVAIIEKLMPDLEKIFSYVNSEDGRFSKDVRNVGSYYQGLKVKRSDEFDFNLLLNGYHVTFLNKTSCPHSARQATEKAPTAGSCPYGFAKKKDASCTEELWRKAHTTPQRLSDSMTNIHITLDKSYSLENKEMALDRPGAGYYILPVDRSVVEYESLMFPPNGSGVSYLIPYYVKLRMKELLTKAIEKCTFKGSFTLSSTAHGPALTFTYDHPSDTIKFSIDVDISPTVRCSSCTLQCLGTWPTAGSSQWPPSETVETLKSTSISFVAKQNFYWYLNFAECEKELVKYCDTCDGDKRSLCRKKVQRIMKSLHKRFWCPDPGAKQQISSYVIKNVWMLEMEKFPRADDWTEDKLSARLLGCIESLMKYIDGFIRSDSSLPQYFQRANNLLVNKDKAELKKEYEKIKDFYNNPTEYI